MSPYRNSMKKTLILGPQEIWVAIGRYIVEAENIEIPFTATIDARVRNPESGAPETYLIVSWDAAE